jgi:anti-sigma factor RsiW
VTHPEFTDQVDAYLDDELDRVQARALEAHLAGCSECARFRDDRVTLREAIRAGLPGLRAPDMLRKRVEKAVRSAPPIAAGGRSLRWASWRPLALAASVAVVVVGAWRLGERKAGEEALAEQVLSSHVRSLMPGHLTDVPSTDQHTVKPWFNGRLDFSPPVHDFSERGYPLVGGRLDYVGGRPVAALVYGRRQHLINLFLWPGASGSDRGPAVEVRQGYNLLHWSASGYDCWLVSDLGLTELREFMGLLKEAEAATTSPQ